MQNDEDEDENVLSAGRFPCMPSLASLQFMRNRLHLAHLGRKLMKWTAMATGRELRKIAIALNMIYDSFCEDMSNAFLLLARGRYFCPNMNKMVLENIATKAGVTVVSAMKSHAAVKMIQYDLCESGVEPYEHLGLEKGGQQIHEAKVAWLQLLKRLILMMEMRNSFLQVQDAHRNATKRMNVMNKVIVPKTKATIKYIILELEEMAREELFRIKIIKKKKLKVRQTETKRAVCPICKKEIDCSKTKSDTSQNNSDKNLVKVKNNTNKNLVKAQNNTDKNLVKVLLRRPESNYELPEKESFKLVAKPSPTISIKFSASPSPATHSKPTEDQLSHLKKLLTEVIVQGKNVVETGLSKIDVDKFLSICEEARTKIDNFFWTDDKTFLGQKSDLKERLNNLKSLLHEVIELTHDFENSVNIAANVENFIESCEQADIKLDVIMSRANSSLPKKSGSCLKEGISTCSSKHSGRQENIPSKISCTKTASVHFDRNKLNNLQERVDKLEEMSANVRIEGMSSTNLDKLSLCCKDFKGKLEVYKNKVRSQLKASSGDSINKLLKHINSKGSCSETQSQKSSVPDYALDLVKCCKNIKKLCQDIDENEEKPEVSNEISSHIDCLINMIKQLKDETLACKDDTCEIEWGHLLNSKETSTTDIKTPCKDFCTCGEQSVESECTLCNDIKETEPLSSLTQCKTCNEELSEEEVKTKCHMCSEISQQSCDDKHSIPESCCNNPSNDTLGIFEKKIKRIVRVTRSLNDDGTVREEKEIITITRKRHDPNITLADDDDTDNHDDCSFTSGCLRTVKSEGSAATTKSKPPSRQCSSHCGNSSKGNSATDSSKEN